MRIKTNFEELYIKGEKSGSETVTLTSSYPISISIDEYTKDLNGSVSYEINGNGTSNVSITFTYSNLYVNGETYSATITAVSSTDALNIPVVINCSDTLIYIKKNKGNGFVKFSFSSSPEINSLKLKGSTDIDITSQLDNGLIIFNDSEFKTYDYLIASNGLSQITIDTHNYDDVPDFVIYDYEAIYRSNTDRPQMQLYSYGDGYGDYQNIKVYDVRVDGNVCNSNVFDIPFQNDIPVVKNWNVVFNFNDEKERIYIDGLFRGCHDLVRVNNMDTSKVVSMHGMFSGCTSLTSIPQLDTSNVTNMHGMFSGCTSLTSIPQLDTIKATNVYGMFSGCTSLTSIPQLDTIKATNVYGMFSGCTSLTSVPKLDFYSAIDMDRLFENCTSLTSIPKFRTQSVESMNYMFSGCTSLTKVELFETYRVIYAANAFSGCTSLTSVPQFDFRNLIVATEMFKGCTSLKQVSFYNTHQDLLYTDYMFEGCTSLTSISMYTTNAQYMNGMFKGCTSLTTAPELDLSKTRSMGSMFYGCTSLTTIPQWDTHNIESMDGTFKGCTSLTSIPQLNTSNVTSMIDTFEGCTSLTSIPQLNTSNVTVMLDTFYGCSNLTNLGGFSYLKTSLDLSYCPLLTHESLMNVINKLGNVTESYLWLGVDNLNKLTDDEIAIAINKGWIVS